MEGDALSVGPGRPPHSPNDEVRSEVKRLASCGVSHEDISAAIGISPNTLRKYYDADLRSATAIANSLVAGALFKTATESEGPSHVTAAIFWLKTRAGWKETAVVETKDTTDEIDWSLYTPEEIAQMRSLMERGVSGA